MKTITEAGLRRQSLARRGEDAAAAHLAARGYRILGRNVRFRHGELDIVARDGATIVFVEVKTRASDRLGPPQEAVHGLKQHRVRCLAQAWLQRRGLQDVPCRFDVIAVRVAEGSQGEAMRLQHFEAAFDGE